MFGRSAKSMDEFDKNKKLLGEYDLIDDDLEKELCDLERKPRAKVMNRAVTDTHREWRGDNMCSKDLAIPNPRSPQEALEQRLSKYQSGVESALKEGNGNKERRMGRIVKQYEDALKALKAGEAVDFSQLPNPPGYPPIPVGVSSKTPPLPVPVQESAGAVLTAKPKEPVGVVMAQGHGRSRPAEEHGSYGQAEDKGEVDPSVPQSKNLLEAQRHEECRGSVDSCKAEGNGSNAQRMGRTVEQKKVAVKLVKAVRKEIDGDQDLCEIFRYLATSTEDANEKKSYLIQCISEMGENSLSVGVRMIAEKLEASPKVAEQETDERALSEGTDIKPVQPVEASEQLALSGGDVWRDSVDAEQVLGHFQDQFLKEMNAVAIVHQHEEDQDVISSPDTMKIRESVVWTELNETPFDHFKQTCTKAMRGHPEEGALGADTKSMLEEPVFPSEPLLKGFTCVTVQNEPSVDEHAIQDSPPSSDDLGETQDGDSLPQYQPKTLPVAPPPTSPTTPPHNEGEECDEPTVAEEDSLEVRCSSAASFADNHSSQPSVPQGFPLYTPNFAQEPLSSSDASSLKFSEQLTEETPQPHPPVGSGPVEEGEQLTEETPQLNKAVEEHGPQGDAKNVDDEQVMTENDEPKDRIGGVDFHINVCFGTKSAPLHEQIQIASAACKIVWPLSAHPLWEDDSQDSDRQASQKQTDDIISGSGSIVAYNEKFYLLSCCHNFLTRDHACRLGKLKDDDVKQEIKRNCKKAQFHFSTKDFKSTVPVSADVVLKNCEDPVLVFDKVHDLLAIKVNKPAGFSAAALHPIHPIPLQPSAKIADCDIWLMVAHFPWDEYHKAKCLEISCGLRRMVNVHQDTQVTYMLDTYHGSSGAPVLLATDDGNLKLVAVHRKIARGSGICKIGSIPIEDFLSRL